MQMIILPANAGQLFMELDRLNGVPVNETAFNHYYTRINQFAAQGTERPIGAVYQLLCDEMSNAVRTYKLRDVVVHRPVEHVAYHMWALGQAAS